MSRFECKYYLSEMQYDQVRRWIDPYMRPDDFAARHPGNRYLLSSLYLDSPDFRIGRMTASGLRNRFKLRIRAYSDDPAMPVFFEVKRKADGMVSKTRVKLPREIGAGLLEGRICPAEAAGGEDLHELENFMSLCHSYNAGPVMRVRYEREAYQSIHGEPLRITFDRELAYVSTPDANFELNGPGWSPVETPVIFEVKFPDYFPFWIGEMVRQMQLKKISIPKYNLSLDARGSAGHHRAMLEGFL